MTEQPRPAGPEESGPARDDQRSDPTRPGPHEAGRATAGGAPAEPGEERIVIKDKRKINVTEDGVKANPADNGGESRADPATATSAAESDAAAGAGTTVGDTGDGATATTGTGALGAELESLRSALDERTRDLQRVSAEYANYRKRVDRDRGLVAEQATGAVLAALLPVLDDLDRARDHGDLVGPFGSVAEALTATLGKFGLTPFGEKGDAFDPTRHEAVAHRTSSEVSEPTCVEVMRRGYMLGDRLLRAALVAVADPE